MNTEQVERNWLRFPIISSSAEFLVMGHLMRRNILAYKAPQNHEGYDLICIHPDPRHRPTKLEKPQVRIQVKSRYATDCDRGFPIRDVSLDAFDFLVVAFLNIGRFSGKKDGSEGEAEPEYYTLPAKFVRRYHDSASTWQKVRLGGLTEKLQPYKNALGFEKVANALGVRKPTRQIENPKLREKRVAALEVLFNQPPPYSLNELLRMRRAGRPKVRGR